MKKLISCVLAGALMATALAGFAGCGQEYHYDAIDTSVDLTKPITLKGYFPGQGGEFGKDDTAKIIERETGYKVDYIQGPATALEGDVTRKLGGKEPYHFMKLNDACFSPHINDGSFCDLTDVLKNTPQGKVLYQLIDLMDRGWDAVTTTDEQGNKHIYGIPDFGYVHMINSGFIWNMDHLKKIGFSEQFQKEKPETVEEFTWAVNKFQETFGGDQNKGYHALGIPGSGSLELEPLAGAFELPYNFYVDENNKIQIKYYHPNYDNYIVYMNKFHNSGALSPAWGSADANELNQQFAKENYSVIYTPYYYVTSLVNAVVDKEIIAKSMGTENTYWNMYRNAISWTLKLRGDGTNGSVNQTKAKLRGDPGAVAFYNCIPSYMSAEGMYVIDYFAKKMEAFGKFFGGNGLMLEEQAEYDNDPAKFPQETHWYEVDTPAGAPAAADYTEAKDAEYTAYEIEHINEMYCFIRPYSYTYKDTRTKDVGGHSEDGSEVEVEVTGGGYWTKLTKRCVDYIANNSLYCTGTQAIEAKAFVHVHEIAFQSWMYCDNYPDLETWISDPMYLAPFVPLWGPVNITSRSRFVTGEENSINTKSKGDKELTREEILKAFNLSRSSAKTQFTKKDGVKYYYWSDAISDQMTEWYLQSKNNPANK